MGASTLDAEETHGGSGSGSDRYYGSSSAVSFLQQAYDTVAGESPSSTTVISQKSGGGPRGHFSDEPVCAGRGKDQFSPLPRLFMDPIMDFYWDKLYHVYPFIHKPTFMQAYQQLWTDPARVILTNSEVGLGGSVEYGPHSLVFHCALNTMLALAIEGMSSPVDGRRGLAKVFADKARGLFHLDFFDDGSLAIIQTCLLHTQYLQATIHPNRCWNMIGISCRLAQASGLNVEDHYAVGHLSPLAMEMRRRIWHGCVLLDTVVSLTLGRPLTLYKHRQASLPSPVDDEHVTVHDIDARSKPAVSLSRVEFYVQTIKLYEIMADVVSHMYMNPEAEPTEILHQVDRGFGSFAFILKTESRISGLEERIPDYLHWRRRENMSADVRSMSPFGRQSAILQARYLHLRIFLYRPTFILYCQRICAPGAGKHPGGTTNQPPTDMTMHVAGGMAVACVESSITLIEIIHQRATSTTPGQWWYNLYVIRTAAIVVLLAMLCSSRVKTLHATELDLSWETCKATLVALERFSLAVARCLKGLQKLHRHVSACMVHVGDFQDASQQQQDGIDVDMFNFLPGERNFFTHVLDGTHKDLFLPLDQGFDDEPAANASHDDPFMVGNFFGLD